MALYNLLILQGWLFFARSGASLSRAVLKNNADSLIIFVMGRHKSVNSLTKRFQVSLRSADFKRLAALAVQRGLPAAVLVRKIILDILKKSGL